jgi:hypothetical protein
MSRLDLMTSVRPEDAHEAEPTLEGPPEAALAAWLLAAAASERWWWSARPTAAITSSGFRSGSGGGSVCGASRGARSRWVQSLRTWSNFRISSMETNIDRMMTRTTRSPNPITGNPSIMSDERPSSRKIGSLVQGELGTPAHPDGVPEILRPDGLGATPLEAVL